MGFGSYVTMKSLLICFNIVFCVLAVVLIAIGGLVQHGMKTSTEPTPSEPSSWFNDTNVEMSSDKKGAVAAVSIVLIVIGCSAFFLAFLGCCGAIHDSKFMLITYGILVSIVFIIQTACGVFALVLWKSLTSPEFDPNKKSLFLLFGIFAIISGMLELTQVIFAFVLSGHRSYTSF